MNKKGIGMDVVKLIFIAASLLVLVVFAFYLRDNSLDTLKEFKNLISLI